MRDIKLIFFEGCPNAERVRQALQESGVEFIKKYYIGFEEEIHNYGLGSISEVYDGDPPHVAGGTISQAWSVSELLRVGVMLEKYEKKKPGRTKRSRRDRRNYVHPSFKVAR